MIRRSGNINVMFVPAHTCFISPSFISFFLSYTFLCHHFFLLLFCDRIAQQHTRRSAGGRAPSPILLYPIRVSQPPASSAYLLKPASSARSTSFFLHRSIDRSPHPSSPTEFSPSPFLSSFESASLAAADRLIIDHPATCFLASHQY